MDFENWLGTFTTVAIMCGAMLTLGRWLRTQTADQISAFKASVDRQFAGVDQRFAGVDQRFAVVDQRFADMDRRFEDMDRRFADMDRRFEDVNQRFADMSRENKADHGAIRRSIQESTRQVLGLMDRRFEDAGKRMDEMSKRIDDLRSHVDSGGRAVLGREHA